MTAEELVNHLLKEGGTDAIIVIDGDGTETVARLLAAGWTYDSTEHVYGKRVRNLRAPEAAP